MSMKDTMQTTLSGYVIKTFADQAYFEHYFDLGPYGKAFLSPLEHIGILTWHRMLMSGFDNAPLIIRNDSASQLQFLKIDCGHPNDFDLLKKLAAGYEFAVEGIGHYLADNSNKQPLMYHDTLATIEYGRFYDEPAWILKPVFMPTGSFTFGGKKIKEPDMNRLEQVYQHGDHHRLDDTRFSR